MTEGGNPQELLKKKKSKLKKNKNPTLCYKGEFPFGQNAKQLCQKQCCLGVSSCRTCSVFNPTFPTRRMWAVHGDPWWWGALGEGPTSGDTRDPQVGAGRCWCWGWWGRAEHGLTGLWFFCTWVVKGGLCGGCEYACLSASPAIIQSTSAPFDRDAKAGKIPSSYRSSENRSLEDLGDFRGH